MNYPCLFLLKLQIYSGVATLLLGPPVNFFGNSDTYHLWAIIGTYNVAIHDLSPSSDVWLRSIWPQYLKAVAASTAKVDSSSGLFVVTAGADWARAGQGGKNIAANCL